MLEINTVTNGPIAKQVDSFTPAHSAFGLPIYVALLPAASIQGVCHDTLDFIQVPGYLVRFVSSRSRTPAVLLFNASRGLSLSR